MSHGHDTITTSFAAHRSLYHLYTHASTVRRDHLQTRSTPETAEDRLAVLRGPQAAWSVMISVDATRAPSRTARGGGGP